MQRRADSKHTFAGYWTNTCCRCAPSGGSTAYAAAAAATAVHLAGVHDIFAVVDAAPKILL